MNESLTMFFKRPCESPTPILPREVRVDYVSSFQSSLNTKLIGGALKNSDVPPPRGLNEIGLGIWSRLRIFKVPLVDSNVQPG